MTDTSKQTNLSSEGTDLVLVGKPDLLKPALTTVLAVAQLIEQLRPVERQKPFVPKRANKPKVILHFKESKSSYLKSGRNYPHEGEISFRIMDRDSKTIRDNDLQRYANKIISAFAKPPFQWKKGKEMTTYNYWEEGYGLQVLCINKAEGMRVIEQILDIQNYSPELEFVNHITNSLPAKKYPDTHKTTTILGKSVEQPIERPIVTVLFNYAEIFIPGIRKPIVLCDLSGKRDALVQIDAQNKVT